MNRRCCCRPSRDIRHIFRRTEIRKVDAICIGDYAKNKNVVPPWRSLFERTSASKRIISGLLCASVFRWETQSTKDEVDREFDGLLIYRTVRSPFSWKQFHFFCGLICGSMWSTHRPGLTFVTTNCEPNRIRSSVIRLSEICWPQYEPLLRKLSQEGEGDLILGWGTVNTRRESDCFGSSAPKHLWWVIFNFFLWLRYFFNSWGFFFSQRSSVLNKMVHAKNAF